jgi:hypothetical protein
MSDPNEALARIRALLALRETPGWEADTMAILDGLADTVQALDEWMTKGGFLPKEWMNFPRPATGEQVVNGRYTPGPPRTRRHGRAHPGRPGGQNSGA